MLSERLGAIHVRSDVERKCRAGLDAFALSGSGVAQDLYASSTSAAVYDALARAAQDILAGGYTAIVDATFLGRERRARFAELGARLGIRVHLVYCDAPIPVLRARIDARRRSGGDPSEANTTVLDWQLSHFEPLSPEEPFEVHRVETAEPGALGKILRGIGTRAPLVG